MAVIIVAALLALLQIGAQRAGVESPIAAAGSSLLAVAEMGSSATIASVRGFIGGVAALPGLAHDVAALRAQNERLQEQNARLHQLAAAYAAQTQVRPVVQLYSGIEARVIGFPPENALRAITIDKGSRAGVQREDGVVAPSGAVGKVVAVGPLSSQVVLLTDYTSRTPAVVRRGRWWGIARGNLGSIRVEYISQDAPLRIGDTVVTGEGRSFHAGVPIGTVTAIERGDATLYQTAIVKPAADLGALDRVVVLKR